MTDATSCDLAIVGGGLAGGLIALAYAQQRPTMDVRVIESEARLGGNHVWSFFDSDVNEEGRTLLAPMIAHRWQGGHDVRFPGFARTLASPYNSITSDRFDAHVRAVLGKRVMCGTGVEAMTATAVTLADGRMMQAGAVIDARGFSGPDDAVLGTLACGWQKFVGQALRLAAPHGLTRPVIMDATVEQIDGYRFIYLLPTGEHEIFVEDTYYSDAPEQDVTTISGRIAAYAAALGWQVKAVAHQEAGVLPVVISGDFDSFWPAEDQVARAGVRAGLFHPTTGYSLPDAVDFALDIARRPVLDSLADWMRARAARHWRKGGYYRLLDTMLFRAASPQERYRIFARFYGLDERLIGRFYSGQSSIRDRFRILCGRPPVPIRAAMQALRNRQVR